MKQSPIACAGRLDVWLELDTSSAAWEERIQGALVLRGTRGMEHVSLAEVRLDSPPINTQGDACFTLELDSTRWGDFLVGAGENIRIPFFLTVPWGVGFDVEADLIGKVWVHDKLAASVGVTVRFLPPQLFVHAAEAFARTTGLVVQHWYVTDQGDGAIARLGRTKGNAASLKAAELWLCASEGELHCRLRAEWSGPKLGSLWRGHPPNELSYRFRLSPESPEVMEHFFRQELLPLLQQRQSGSFPVPAGTTATSEEQLPRIVPEAQADLPT